MPSHTSAPFTFATTHMRARELKLHGMSIFFPVSPYGPYENHIPIQWAALRKRSDAHGPPVNYWALTRDGGVGDLEPAKL
jgi:hypothetical protein